MQAIEQWVRNVADEWWLPLLVWALSLIDGFFPTVPSESVLVTLGSLSTSTGRPYFWLLVLAGWLGALMGDHIAYYLGRWIGWSRFAFFRQGRGRAAIDAAQRGLDSHALIYFMTARFIPLGRTAVNLTAGALNYSRRKFTHRIVPATLLWALYSTTIGAVAGRWFHDHPLLGIVVALAIALITSIILERIARKLRAVIVRRLERSFYGRGKVIRGDVSELSGDQARETARRAGD